MKPNVIVNKVKKRFRPVGSSTKKFISKKKNQRRLIYIVGFAVIVALLGSLVLAINKQNDLQREQIRLQVSLADTNHQLKKNQQAIKELKDDVNTKQKTLEANAQTIKEKEQKQAELEEKIEQLTKQVSILKSYGSGIGGGVHQTTSYAASGNVSSGGPNAYGYGYCTWYVKNRRPDIGGYWGNANQWYASAQAAGYNTGSEAQPGAIGVSFEGSAGHVVYVESVNGDTIHLSEMNGAAGWNVVGERDAPESAFVYIYGKA